MKIFHPLCILPIDHILTSACQIYHGIFLLRQIKNVTNKILWNMYCRYRFFHKRIVNQRAIFTYVISYSFQFPVIIIHQFPVTAAGADNDCFPAINGLFNCFLYRFGYDALTV